MTLKALLTLTLALALLGAALGPAGAASTWTRASTLALPSGATSLPQGYLPALACPRAGECVAVGQFVDSRANTYGLVATETKGHWGAARHLIAPSGAATGSGLLPVAVACSAVGACVVVGSYLDQAGNQRAFYDVEVKGVWRSAAALPLPANAASAGTLASLHGVACSPGGPCVAAGEYLGPHGTSLALLATYAKGAWRVSAGAPPAGAGANPFVQLTQVACGAAGRCTAAGTYLDTDNVSHPLAYSLRAGAWGTPARPALPANASAYATASVGGEGCSSDGSCVVVGTYETLDGRRGAYAASQVAGAWQRARALVLPTSANPLAFFYGFADVSCPASGGCSVGGQFRSATGAYQGFLVNEVGGNWRVATTLPLPGGATSTGANGGVVALSCTAVGSCAAGAAYLDGAGNYQGLLINETGGTWGAPVPVALPGSAASVGVDGGVYALSCHVQGCSAVGSYLDGTGSYQGFTLAGH